jgi:hypothetical protein
MTAVSDLLDSIFVFLSLLSSRTTQYVDREFTSPAVTKQTDSWSGNSPERSAAGVPFADTAPDTQLRAGPRCLVDHVGYRPRLRDHRQVSGFHIGDL